MAINYVKFLRGTPTAFAKLSQKDNDTLYFISEANSKRGSLYLGEKLISESVANLEDLNNILRKAAVEANVVLKEAIIHSSDVFYHTGSFSWEKTRDEKGCKAVEMESYALFANAIASGKKAACLLTISDSFITHEVTSAEERQNSFTNMMKVALELALHE
jgi:purine-nucleoside phosphorylase